MDYQTTNWFKKIYNYVNTLSKAGDYKLGKIYYKINTGKYRNVIVDNAKIDRFNELYKDGGAPYRIQGVKFAYISNYA